MSDVKLPATFKATHETGNLPGYPAVDVFGSPGSSVLAPASGTLVDVHLIPWDLVKRVGGYTAYLVTSSGTYFLTHFGTVLPSGSKVQAGQRIGTVAAVPQGAWGSHIHEGFDAGNTTGPAGVTTSTGGGGSSIDSTDSFWYAVETRLSLPHNRATHDFLVGWSNVEGTKAKYNPLATTLRQPGSTSFNSVGVQNYPTPEAGVQATADTLKNYPGVLAVLRGKATPFGNTRLYADLNKWSGHASLGSQESPYVTSVLRQFQGNPSGKGAADWFSGDAGLADAATSAKDAALAVPRFLAKLTDPSYILRGLQVVAGAVLALAGVALLVRQVALAADLPDPVGLASKAASRGVIE